MKNIIIFLAIVFSFNAFSEIQIEKFELLKTLDGKLQKCKSRSDYFKPGTYKLFTMYRGQPVVNGSVDMFVVLMGQYCHEYKTTNNKYGYIWLSKSLFKDYDYPVFINNREEYVTVSTKDHMLVTGTRSHNTLGTQTLYADPTGSVSVNLDINLEQGILEKDRSDFDSGKSVRSVFFVSMREHQTRTFSWNENSNRQLYTGPTYSLVFTIKK